MQEDKYLPVIQSSFSTEDPLWDEAKTARFLCWDRSTLQKRRWQGKLPAYIKLGNKSVRYRRSDVLAFVNSGLRNSTSQPDGSGES